MSNEAKVRIGGDAAGATRATDQTRKGLKGVGDDAKKAGEQAKRGAEQAAIAEKKYEAEVQKAIQRLKNKETQAKATEDAMKRMGKADLGGMPPSRAAFIRPPPPVGGVAPGGIAQSLSRVGGAGGAAFGGIASSLAAATPALAGLGIAAVGLKVGFDLLTASGRNAAEAVQASADAEEKRLGAQKEAMKKMGEIALAAAAAGGDDLKAALGKGTSLTAIKKIAEQTGLSAEQSTAIASQTRGWSEEDRNVAVTAATNAARMGVDPTKTVEEIAGVRAGLDPGFTLSQFKPEDLLRNAGHLFDNFSDNQLVEGINRGSAGRPVNQEIDRLSNLSAYNNRGGVAAFESLMDPEFAKQADKLTAENAEGIKDPVGTAMKKLNETAEKELKLLEKMSEANGKTNELLADISATLRGGKGSYGGQAAEVRKRLGWFN